MLPYVTTYVALGDSMSIDLYPALDAGEMDVAVALERDPNAGSVAPLGAASLFYQNDDARWPDERGTDLASRYPGIAFHNLASDGATIGDVFGEQLPRLDERERATLVTLTAGGNDLLSAFSNKPRASLLEAIARDVAEAYEFLLDAAPWPRCRGRSRTRPRRAAPLRPAGSKQAVARRSPAGRAGRNGAGESPCRIGAYLGSGAKLRSIRSRSALRCAALSVCVSAKAT